MFMLLGFIDVYILSNYDDLAAAREEIIEEVRKKYGYTLEQEPMELGE